MVSSLLCSGHVFCCRQWGKLASNNNRAAAAAGGGAMKTTPRQQRRSCSHKRILIMDHNTSILTYFIEFTYKIFPNIQHSQIIWTTEARAVHVWLVDNNIVVTMNILDRMSLMEQLHWLDWSVMDKDMNLLILHAIWWNWPLKMHLEADGCFL